MLLRIVMVHSGAKGVGGGDKRGAEFICTRADWYQGTDKSIVHPLAGCGGGVIVVLASNVMLTHA